MSSPPSCIYNKGMPSYRSGQVVLLFLIMAAPLSQAEDALTVARAVDDHYNRLQSSKAVFTEIYTAPGISRTESGTVWLKKSGKMRWEYHNPTEKLFLTDSQNAYFYVPGERQVRKASLKTIDDIRSPLRYLLGKTKLEKELSDLSLAPDVAPVTPGDVVLRGIPKSMADRYSEVVLEVSPAHQIVRIIIRSTDGSSTEFRFSGLEENLPLADSFFHFKAPPGVATIQDQQVAQ
jgi:outer membrane lipoprotein carrier protein